MSKIQWTDLTQNPIRVATGGHYCEKVSPGCQNCYAEKMNKNSWFKGNGHPYKPTKNGPPEMVLNTEMLASWARARKPKKRFVGSMTDIFGEWVPWQMIWKILYAMKQAPTQTFQILTKRPERGAKEIERWVKSYHSLAYFAPPNVWLGSSAEDQQRLDERLIWLIRSQVQTRFLNIDWVIIGGESGPNARPMNLAWVQDILDL